jgi:hypothetical protein
MRIPIPRMFAALLSTALAACSAGANPDEGSTVSAVQEVRDAKKLDGSVCDAPPGDFTLESLNPWFPIDVGWVWEYEGESDGELEELTITVLPDTEVVGGVTTRGVEEREQVDGELVEVSLNFFAVKAEGTAGEGTVCYFGEAVDIFNEDGTVTHEGAWRADDPGNAPGIIMPAEPRPGVRFPMERAPGIAEDEGKIVGIGPVTVPAGTFDDTIRVREFNPLDGGKDFKIFAFGVGLIVDGSVELVSFTEP